MVLIGVDKITGAEKNTMADTPRTVPDELVRTAQLDGNVDYLPGEDASYAWLGSNWRSACIWAQSAMNGLPSAAGTSMAITNETGTPWWG